MNDKTKHYILAGLGIAAILFLGYKVLNPKKPDLNKELGIPVDYKSTVIKYLDETFGADKVHSEFVSNASTSYITSWAKAILSGSPTFTDNGKTYKTGGGKAI